ncbi:hypothetical protein M3Y94_00742400 [Aphelenchoides besseyi]|nr:hypothetical protein M3Y94_00742400 [Aphelenchoides besseyi]KAI6231996.1 hypothetical protein M3Y95_00440300 [Aphelenchoides besseyi]
MSRSVLSIFVFFFLILTVTEANIADGSISGTIWSNGGGNLGGFSFLAPSSQPSSYYPTTYGNSVNYNSYYGNGYY